MKHVIDKNYFPGWVRKSVSFTIDDGNLEMDRKFLDILRPAGIIGTFNLCYPSGMSAEEYRKMYRGYEIANHVANHPELFVHGVDYKFSDEKFDRETADFDHLYRVEGIDALWWVSGKYYNVDPTRWYRITDAENYNKMMDRSHKILSEVFGEGSVRSFVWPFGKQDDSEPIINHVKELGYYGARDAGYPVKSFSLPEDRMNWCYCASHRNLLSVMADYAALPDDGELKFFSFGVHSIDYERDGKWDDLREFAEKYGKRPEEFYYASIGDIFDYEDAIKALVVTDTEIVNDSSLTLYLKLDGERVTIAPKSTCKI